MIPLEKLKSLKHAIVHANCPDGKATAVILKDALPDLNIRFVKYDTEEHAALVPEPNMIFCDFSPWLPKLVNEGEGSAGAQAVTALARERLVKTWNDVGVVVLDHHSRDIVEPYTFGVFGENDKLECGAWLAYEHVWVPVQRSYLGAPRQPGDPSCRGREAMEVEKFARLAAIRDTWKRDDPDFEKACRQASVLMFFRLEQLSLDLMEDIPYVLAQRLFERQIELAETCIKEAFPIVSEKGTRVLMFQGVSATSDAAEILERNFKKATKPLMGLIANRAFPPPNPDLVVGFHYRMDGGSLKLQFSTRSHTGFDCQAFAQAYGGNGHKAAAGFTVSEENVGFGDYNPYLTFQKLLGEWEAR